MSRKAKYSNELKLEIVKRYLKGESASLLANEYGLPLSYGDGIIHWVRRYELLGEKSFESTLSNKAYSKELKEVVIKDYLNGVDSY